MKKKCGFGTLALLLSVLGIFLSISLNNNGVCYGDNLINYLGFKAWSNDTTGIHYTIFYMIVLYIPSILLGIKFKDDFGAKLGKNISICLLIIIAILPLGIINVHK